MPSQAVRLLPSAGEPTGPVSRVRRRSELFSCPRTIATSIAHRAGSVRSARLVNTLAISTAADDGIGWPLRPPLRLVACATSSVKRLRSAVSSWFKRLVRSAIPLSTATLRLRAMMLSSATTKEPSPLRIATPSTAETGATKSMNAAKESRPADNAEVTLRANTATRTGTARRPIPIAPKFWSTSLKFSR
jgi:hypothetical protein